MTMAVMDIMPTLHSASHRGAAIRRILDERRADQHHRVVITFTGSGITLDGVVDSYADKEAAVDAALWAGEADVIIDRISVVNRRERAARPSVANHAPTASAGPAPDAAYRKARHW